MRVEDHMLVIWGQSERPYILLIEFVIDQWHIRVRRVSVDRLTLLVVVVEERIVIIDRDDCGFTFNTLSFVLLHPLEVIVLVERVSIEIVVVLSVLINVGVPSVELVIDEGVA